MRHRIFKICFTCLPLIWTWNTLSSQSLKNVTTSMSTQVPNKIPIPKSQPISVNQLLPSSTAMGASIGMNSVAAQPKLPVLPPTSLQPPILPAPTPTPSIEQKPEAQLDDLITLNFSNATLASIVNYLGKRKNINFIPHKALETTMVTLTTRTPLPLNRAWDVLLTLLEMNGFSLVKVGNLYRVVQKATNGQEPLPIYSSETGTDPEDLPDNDLVIRYVYSFKNIKVEIARTIIDSMIDPKNIIDNRDLNVCIIKDKCLNIKAAMRVIKELDTGGLRQSIEVVKLKWANAENVKKLFDGIIGAESDKRVIRFTPSESQKETAYFSSSTKILAEPIKNALILLGTQKNIDRIKAFIAKEVDLPIEDAESRLHIKELRHIRAQDIQPILADMVQLPKGVGEKGLVIEGGYKVFEDVLISAETEEVGGSPSKRGSGNRLIIACNRDDWPRLEEFIDKLDKPQPQVAIEVMIIDVKIGQEKELGAQFNNIRGKPLAKNVHVAFDNLSSGIPIETESTEEGKEKKHDDVKGPLINIADTTLEGNKHATFLTLGKPSADNALDNLWCIIKAVLKFDNSQIISQPYIVANNNQECEVSTQTTFRVKGELENTPSNNPIQKWENIDAIIRAKLTPHINLTGIVDLEIDISIDEFAVDEPTEKPTKTKRILTTKSTMASGEVLVIGGLTKSKLTEGLSRTPILSSIPIIGTLFKRKSKTKDESNLYVFIRPSIIKPRFEGAPDEYTQLKLDYAKYQIMKNDTYVKDQDPIQRWFFRPTHQTIKHRLADAARGVLRPIDNFTYGRNRPKMVNISEDPYYKTSEAVEKARKKRKAKKTKRKKQAEPLQPVPSNNHLDVVMAG